MEEEAEHRGLRLVRRTTVQADDIAGEDLGHAHTLQYRWAGVSKRVVLTQDFLLVQGRVGTGTVNAVNIRIHNTIGTSRASSGRSA